MGGRGREQLEKQNYLTQQVDNVYVCVLVCVCVCVCVLVCVCVCWHVCWCVCTCVCVLVCVHVCVCVCVCVLVCVPQHSQPWHDVVDILHHLIQVLEHLVLVEVNQQELLQVGQLVTHGHVWLHC